MITINENALIRIFGDEKMKIEPYSKNSFRVRITREQDFTGNEWALLPQAPIECEIRIGEKTKTKSGITANTAQKDVETSAYIINGNIKAVITKAGKLSFERTDGTPLLREFEFEHPTCLGLRTRELKRSPNGGYRASLKFASDPNEKIFGMGQYQNGIFDLKGSVLELAQRNSQASVPFMVSSLGYGFLWNNPAIGSVMFGKNITEWEAQSTREIDFWITCGDTPAEILEQYMNVTGKPTVMPEEAIGFHQCKLRYATQTQLTHVAKEYHRRHIPLSMIVIDFFHWRDEGDWKFDRKFWPFPGKMVKQIQNMGTDVMVSVWPTVSLHAKNYKEMREKGYLVHSENGVDVQMMMVTPTSFVDFTNPEAREYLWNKIKENYFKYNIKYYWLDVAEPEYSGYDFENYNYHIGSALEVSNIYPLMYAKTFYDGLKSSGVESPMSLIRCAWAGSQRYGALVWSGDINSTFTSLKNQIVCGQQMAMAGIPWWTTDIGGFADGESLDHAFRELLVRWFQFGTFCPVMRLHGNRAPGNNVIGSKMGSGGDNEIWSFGKDNYKILKKYISIRENIRPYIRKLTEECAKSGAPIIRPLFYSFPTDKEAWQHSDEYLFGGDLLVAPVTELGATERSVYLPDGAQWIHVFSNTEYDGGQEIICPAPISEIPLFIRKREGGLTAEEILKQ